MFYKRTLRSLRKLSFEGKDLFVVLKTNKTIEIIIGDNKASVEFDSRTARNIAKAVIELTNELPEGD